MSDETRRLTRRQLYNMVWKTPIDVLARDFGMSGRGLGKLCERYSIPVPPRGYWARKAAGYRPKRTPLVEIPDSGHPEIVVDLTFRPVSDERGPREQEPVQDLHREMFERLLNEIGILEVRRQLRNPHSLIQGWLKQEEEDRRRAQDSFYGREYFRAKHSTRLGRRRLRVLNVLFAELERRGCRIEHSHGRGEQLTVWLNRDSVEFTIGEEIRHIRRRLTGEEKAGRYGSRQEWTQYPEETGELALTLAARLPKSVPQKWKDEDEQPLEAQVANVLAGILTGLAHARAQREEREKQERDRRAQEQEQQRREAERQAELKRKLGLRQRAKAWQIANHIREYVEAVEQAEKRGDIGPVPGNVDEWASWARAHADEIDPLATADPLGTALLWNEDDSHTLHHGSAPYRRGSGDPTWFWGKRWWLK